MARTIAEIEAGIDKEAAKHTELDRLQSNSSKVSYWKYVKKIVAVVVITVEKMLEKHKKEMNALIESTETGSINWYLKQCYNYQYGDSLVIENNRPIYASLNVTKQIVKRASIKENTEAVLLIKVAKETGGVLGPLDDTQLASFKTYLNRIKIAGTKLDIQSQVADQLTLQADVILDLLLFNAEGQLLSDTSSAPVITAINEQLKAFNFGGVFYLSKLIDQVMNVAGVKDFYLSSATLNGVAFNRSAESTAGYITLHEDTEISYVLS